MKPLHQLTVEDIRALYQARILHHNQNLPLQQELHEYWRQVSEWEHRRAQGELDAYLGYTSSGTC